MAPKKDAKKDAKKDELSPEEKLQAELKLLDAEKSDLNIELSFLKDKIGQARRDKDFLRSDVDVLRTKLAKATSDYADILEHRESQIKASEVRVHNLQRKVEDLERELEKRARRIKELEEECKCQQAKLEECGNLLSDKEQLEDVVRQQHKLIDKQNEELRNYKEQLQDKEGLLGKATVQIDDLTLKASDTNYLKILFDDICMVEVKHRKLYGNVPVDREFATLSCVSGKQIILFGGSGSGECVPREVCTLDLETMEWGRPSSAKTTHTMASHSTTSVSRTKLLTYGGTKNGTPTSDVAILNTDTLKWQVLGAKPAVIPSPRTNHACCAVRERVYVFGGEVGGNLSNELWVLDQDSLQWTRVMTFGVEPSPRKGASICASEDGRRLYVTGGNDGTKVLNDVYMLETERLTWSAINVNSPSPQPREGHCSTVISHFLWIAGGLGVGKGGAAKKLGDVHILDLSTPTWEVLDDGMWVSNRPWLKQNACYFSFCGSTLMTVKPDREDNLNELQIMKFILPEDIERMKNQKKRDNKFQEKLELLDDAVCTANSIEVGWRPPTKNVDRIDHYKLMMGTTTGMVKDICKGKHLRYKVVGLKPNSEYIFCVKANFDDGSFLWSESRPFYTKIVRGH